MTVTIKDGLFTFGSQEIVEVPAYFSATLGDIGATNDATQKAPLGCLYRHKGNVYRYVKFNNGAGNVASIAGGVVHWYSINPENGTFTVTSDYTDSLGVSVSGKNGVAGLTLGVVTDGYYTWIQVGGVHLLAYVSTSNAAGDVMIYSATDNTFGRCAADAAVTGIPYGVAMAVDSPTGYGPVLLLNLIW